MKRKFTTKLTNAIDPPAPTSVWNYKGCAGKSGKTRNATIANTKTETKGD